MFLYGGYITRYFGKFLHAVTKQARYFFKILNTIIVNKNHSKVLDVVITDRLLCIR